MLSIGSILIFVVSFRFNKMTENTKFLVKYAKFPRFQVFCNLFDTAPHWTTCLNKDKDVQ